MTELLYNAANDFEYAKNDPNAEIYDSGNSIPNANLRKFITEDKNTTNNGTIDVKNMKGVFYNANSNVSKSVSNNLLNNPQTVREIIKNANILKENSVKISQNNQKIPKGGEKYYSNAYVDKMNVYMNDINNKYDIGNCTLYNPHIDSDGHFRAQLLDIVDFDHKDYSDVTYAYIPNEWGVKMQQSGKIPKVFGIIEIDIPDIQNKLGK